MGRMIAVITLGLFVTVASGTVYAASLIDAKDTISNATLSTNQKTQSAVHMITMTTATSLTDGTVKVTIPAATADNSANDGVPDRGRTTASSGFDLDRLTSSQIRCAGGAVRWLSPQLIPSSQSNTGEHEIHCAFKGTIKSNSILTITIGETTKSPLNAQKVDDHTRGEADIYTLRIQTIDSADNLADNVFVQVALTDEVTTSTDVKVTAVVGKYALTIFGYTSPRALVELDGQSIHATTHARADGYFIFDNTLAPLAPQEVCLIATDLQGRLTPPLCLSPFPIDYSVRIGPVILAPTLSINQGNYLIGSRGILSGLTIPHSTVALSFSAAPNSIFVQLVKAIRLDRFLYKVRTFTFPKLETRADAEGRFSMTVPTSSPSFLHVFAKTLFRQAPSAKSITLHTEVLPWWMIIIKGGILLVWSILRRQLWNVLLIIVLMGMAILLLELIFHPLIHARTRAIVLRKKFPIVPTQK